MSCPWSGFTPSPFIPYCEEQLCSWVVNPADTWTNIAFLVAAFFILKSKQTDRTLRGLFGFTTIAVGICSVLFHMSITRWGAILDMDAMLVISMLLIAIALRRLRSWSTSQTILFYSVGTVISVSYPLWISTGKPVFGAQILIAAALEFWQIHRGRPGLDPKYFFLTIGAFAAAVLFLMLDVSHVLCLPQNHIFTGHGAWHFLNALALYLLFKANTTTKAKS